MAVAIIILVATVIITIVWKQLDFTAINNAKQGFYCDWISVHGDNSLSRKLLNKWLDEHPQSKAIYRKIRDGYLNGDYDEENIAKTGDNLIEMGAKIVIMNGKGHGTDILVVTDEMVVAGEPIRYEVYIAPNRERVLKQIHVDYTTERTAVTTSVKQQSVVKSAVVGGVVAGGVGAVVGAAAALNHNNHSAGKTETTFIPIGKKEEGLFYHYLIVNEPCSYRFRLEKSEIFDNIKKPYGADASPLHFFMCS